MSDNAIASHGTLISRNGTVIDGQKDITMPSFTKNTFESTGQADDDDCYVAGIRRKGDLSFAVNYLPSGAVTQAGISGLRKAWYDGSKDLYKGQYPDGSYWLCSGLVTNIAPKAPVEGVLEADVTVKLTGAFIFYAM